MIINNLGRQMHKSRMYQKTLASKVGTYQAVVSDVCNGSRIFNAPTFMRVCKVLGCKPTDIYDENTLGTIYPEIDFEKMKEA